MKLLLSSTEWKKNLKIRKEFLKLVNKEPSKIVVFLVNTATKRDKEWRYVKFHIKELKKIGVKERNIKIFDFTKKVNPSDLQDIDIIYVCGGNTFHYLSKMRKIELDKKIIKLVKKGVSYFGISAGSIVAGPRVDIARIGRTVPGDKNDVRLKDLTGLKLTNTIIYPHYTKEDEVAIREFEKQNRCKVLRLRDKQALLIKGKIKKVIK